MGKKVGSLDIAISATTSGLSKGFKQAEQMTQSFSGRVSKVISGPSGIGGAIAGAFAGVTVTAALAYCVKQFSAVEEAQQRLQTAFKATSGAAGVSVGEVKQMATQLSQTTRFAQSATENAAAGLAKYQQIKGPNFTEAIRQAQNLATVTGKDLPSATEELGSALQVPRTGYLELAKAGVMFSDAQVDQIQSMSDAGNVAGAQTVILQALQEQYGSAAEAAGGTMAGKLDILHNSLSNVAAIIGEAVSPVINVVLGQLAAWVNSVDKVALRNKAFEVVASSIGLIANVLQVMDIGWKAAKIGADWMLFGAIKAVALLVEGLEKSVNWLRHLAGLKEISIGAKSLNDFAEGAKQVALDNAKALEAAEAAPWASDKVHKFFSQVKAESDDAMKHIENGANRAGEAIKKGPVAAMHQLSAKAIEAQGSITKMIEDLRQQNKFFGMDDRMKQIAMMKDKGATKGQVAEAKRQALALRGQEITMEVENPFEKFQREMEKLSEVNKSGGIDAGMFARARLKLTQQLWSSLPEAKTSAGGALAHDSTEARTAILNARVGRAANNPQAQLKRVAELQLAQEKGLLSRIHG